MSRVHSNKGRAGLGRAGSVSIVVALLGIVLIGFAALAVDVGLWEVNGNRLQGAADSASVSAAYTFSGALAAGATAAQAKAAAVSEASLIAAAHGFNAASGAVVTVNIPPLAPSPYNNISNAVEVLITQPQTMMLARVVLKTPPTITGRAVAKGTGTAMCMLALSPSGQAITTGTLNPWVATPSCAVYVNSSDPCAINMPSYSALSMAEGYVTGNTCPAPQSNTPQPSTRPFNAFVSASGSVKTGQAVTPDPYASTNISMPASACTNVTIPATPNNNLPAGHYCALNIPAGGGVFLLNSGDQNFFIDGDITVANAAQLYGGGVSVVFTNGGSIKVSGTGLVNLAAPGTLVAGNNRGVAVWSRGTNAFTTAQQSNFTVTGLFYAPNAAVTWVTNNTQSQAPCTQIVAKTITFTRHLDGGGSADDDFTVPSATFKGPDGCTNFNLQSPNGSGSNFRVKE